MYAGKQHLEYVLINMELGVGMLVSIELAKTVGGKECPALVDGNRVPYNLKVRIVCSARVRKTHGTVYPAHGAHRIPHAHEVRFALAGEGLLEIRCNREVYLLFDHPDCVRNLSLIARR